MNSSTTLRLSRRPRRTLYEWIKVGKVRAIETKASDDRMYLTIGDDELSRLREECARKLIRRRLIDDWASIRHIDLKSASRWVKLQEDNGATLEEIQARVEEARKESRRNK